ncbi:hypothetical protein DNTS_033999 [Danionella cerebrum]|uniref:Insulin-like domain-containing protein n=1 Tax=Danionella cerebrum TaxID=2873325 RepID=A0A553RCH9_9TELE|nr:hypothetical protein DNTS_033999 [Danionella translucida]
MPSGHARGLQTLAGVMLKKEIDKLQVCDCFLFLLEQVPGWRSVYVLCSLLCILTLQRPSEATKSRCGRELVEDLEFVCGDRGFYRGERVPTKRKSGSGRRGGSHSQGKGIVEQCCIRGCDLHHLELYCAKPKKEAQFRLVFQRRYQTFADANRNEESSAQRVRERMLYRPSSRDSELNRSTTQTQQLPSAETTSGPNIR